MKIDARIFLLIACFCWLVAVMYGIWTDVAQGRVEVAGLSALILSGGLCFIAGSFFWFVARRIDARPEDRNDAEIAEGAGDLGFFSPGSYWPFGIALSGEPIPHGNRLELCLGAAIGAITFSGSVIAFGKLSGKYKFRLFQGAPVQFKGQHTLNAVLALGLVFFIYGFIASRRSTTY